MAHTLPHARGSTPPRPPASLSRGRSPPSAHARINPLYIRSILIENVPEFATWGPLGSNGRPLKHKAGETYRAFLDALRSLSYHIDTRVLTTGNTMRVLCTLEPASIDAVISNPPYGIGFMGRGWDTFEPAGGPLPRARITRPCSPSR